ncbi:MAG: hypothetical protein AAF846_08710 [Chloroflexota bacterium]
MQQALNLNDAQEQVHYLMQENTSSDEIRSYLRDQGFNAVEISQLMTPMGSKSKRDFLPSDSDNPIENIFSAALRLAISYGVPLMLFLFGASYVVSEMMRDLNVGVRSLAGVLLPLTITYAMRKSDVSVRASEWVSSNRMVAFAVSFGIAMVTAALAMYVRDFNNVIPIGELAFSATLGLLIFGNRGEEQVSFLHIGAVTGFLSYIIFFGIPV